MVTMKDYRAEPVGWVESPLTDLGAGATAGG